MLCADLRAHGMHRRLDGCRMDPHQCADGPRARQARAGPPAGPPPARGKCTHHIYNHVFIYIHTFSRILGISVFEYDRGRLPACSHLLQHVDDIIMIDERRQAHSSGARWSAIE